MYHLFAQDIFIFVIIQQLMIQSEMITYAIITHVIITFVNVPKLTLNMLIIAYEIVR